MKTQDLEKEKAILRQIVEASRAIRRKYHAIKMGKIAEEKSLGDMFKPVVSPLKELVNQTRQQRQQDVDQRVVVKKEEEEEEGEEEKDECEGNGEDAAATMAENGVMIGERGDGDIGRAQETMSLSNPHIISDEMVLKMRSNLQKAERDEKRVFVCSGTIL